ncbi:MAG: hypothetical protein ACRELG_03105 [Gemmataceae bacterium]
MPGVDACGRCGSPLGLQSLAIDVHPPRAAPWTKRLRRWGLPFRSMYNKAQEVGERRFFDDAEGADLLGAPVGILVRLLIPGWAHIHLGQRQRGLLFLGLWLSLLAVAILFFCFTLSGISLYRGGVILREFSNMQGALSLGGIFLGLAFSVHLASCMSVARLGGAESWDSWRPIGLGLIMILAGFYLLGSWLLFGALTAMF